MTRPRKKRSYHGSHFTSDLWVLLVVTVASSCVVASSHHSTELTQNAADTSNGDQSMTERPVTHENHTITTENIEEQIDTTLPHDRSDIDNLNKSISNNTSQVDTTSHEVVLNNANSNITDTVDSTDKENIVKDANELNTSKINELQEFNKEGNITKESTYLSENVTKDIIVNVKSVDESLVEITTTFTNNDESVIETSTIKTEENKLTESIDGLHVNINKSINDDKDETVVLKTKPENGTSRTGKRLTGRIAVRSYEIDTRSMDNSVTKYNSDKYNVKNNDLSKTNGDDCIGVCTDGDSRWFNASNLKNDVSSKSSVDVGEKKADPILNYESNDESVTKRITEVRESALNETFSGDNKANHQMLHTSTKHVKNTKFQNMPEAVKEEGAFFVIRTLAQGVLESVAERVVPSGLLDLIKRMQNQSSALETERLRSKKENGGLGDWGRSVIRSVISDPLNNLMQGVRDNGSLDSNRNFLSGIASGVAYVADSVSESFKDRVKAIFPGTLWCGDGDVARSDELGLFFLTDLCCKNHDACKHYIAAGGTKFGLTNTGIFSRSHCNCDKAFYRCLKKTRTIVSTQIGVTFFSILGPQCFKKEHPILRCKRRTRITGQKCEEYELDETQPKIWQWFDSPTF